MPKKRRTPAQRAASRRNLEKARKARSRKATGVPTGKTVLLMHRTSKNAAKSIELQGFKVSQKNTPVSNIGGGPHVFGVLPATVSKWSGYGESIVGVKVSRKKLKKDVLPGAYKVALKDIKGKKAKRYLEPKKKRQSKSSSARRDFSALFV